MNILIPLSSAYFCASASTFTSKTNKQANYSFLLSGTYDSNDFIALITSYLETGPTEICETGIFYVFKYSSKAYNEPNVEAETPTPRASSLNFF